MPGSPQPAPSAPWGRCRRVPAIEAVRWEMRCQSETIKKAKPGLVDLVPGKLLLGWTPCQWSIIKLDTITRLQSGLQAFFLKRVIRRPRGATQFWPHAPRKTGNRRRSTRPAPERNVSAPRCRSRPEGHRQRASARHPGWVESRLRATGRRWKPRFAASQPLGGSIAPPEDCPTAPPSMLR
jgi:hypothetical protein